MRRKIFVLLLAVVFAFSQFAVVDAKGSSGGRSSSSGSRSISSGSSSSKSSGGYSGSSSSKSSGSSSSGYSGSSSKSSGSSSSSTPSSSSAGSSSSSGYSGSSSSRSIPDSYSTGGSSSTKSSTPPASTSSSSSGYSGSSSSSKSSSPVAGSSSSSGGSSSSAGGSSSSSKSSAPNSSSSSGSAGTASAKSTSSTPKVTSKTDTLKNSYMQDQYKKQVSQNNYSEYKQKLNADQKKVYEDSFSRSYNYNNRMNFEDALRTRPQRITVFNSRPIIVSYNPVYFGGPLSYGSAFAGPWDLWFLMRASDLFWYHHWHDISPYRNYFMEDQFREMERRVQRLEQQHNGVRDSGYLEPGVDPDLQFSSDYQERNLDRIYATNKYSKPVKSPFTTLVVIILIIVALVMILRKVSRPRAGSYNSRIY